MTRKLEYAIPIQDDKKVRETNKSLGADLKDSDWHINNFFDELNDLIWECANEGGYYLGDTIQVKVEISYEPEDK